MQQFTFNQTDFKVFLAFKYKATVEYINKHQQESGLYDSRSVRARIDARPSMLANMWSARRRRSCGRSSRGPAPHPP